ncbi:MAG: glucose-6-phosphate dehydrogenase, partial [Pseudomonadales bacterium]
MSVQSQVVIIGGEGDLAFRKLYPALYSLDCEGMLADATRVFAFGRGRFEEQDFIDEVRRWVDASEYTDAIDETVWQRFSARMIRFVGDATAAESYTRLREQVGGGDRVIY